MQPEGLCVRTERDTALDNLKGILIISVVYVHMYDLLGQKTPLMYTLRLVIMTVQMPLFLFLCGYFGKNVQRRRSAALRDYLLPFLVFNTLYYLIRDEQMEGLRYGFLRPLNMYWFLLTLLLIRLLVPELLRIRHLLPLSILAALLIGFDTSFGRTLSLSRTVCFLPFYLMGLYCTPQQLRRVRRLPVPAAVLGGVCAALLSLWLTDALSPRKSASHPYQLVNSYAAQGLTPSEGVLFRLSIYITAPLLAILCIRLVSDRPGLLTRIGRGSMTVYLLHAFPMLWVVEHWDGLYALLERLLPPLQQVEQAGKLAHGIPQLIVLSVYAFLVSWALSSRPVRRLYDDVFWSLRQLVFRYEPEKNNKHKNRAV